MCKTRKVLHAAIAFSQQKLTYLKQNVAGLALIEIGKYDHGPCSLLKR